MFTEPATAGWPYLVRPATRSVDASRPVLVLALPSIVAYPPSPSTFRSRVADSPHLFVVVEFFSISRSSTLTSLLTVFEAPLSVVIVLLAV
ncbi:MAG: hypothetical protein ACM36C_04930 [Acidobacteriota bacterium]